MKLLSRTGDKFTYEATFWEGPIEPGQQGRRYKSICRDRIYPRRDKEGKVIGHRLLNTARNVSYYPALEKALGIKWGSDGR